MLLNLFFVIVNELTFEFFKALKLMCSETDLIAATTAAAKRVNERLWLIFKPLRLACRGSLAADDLIRGELADSS